MDNRINEIRRKMSGLRMQMARVEDAMRDQIKRDLVCTESALRLMVLRSEMAALAGEWKAAGGSDPLPTIEERLSANNRLAHRAKTRHASPMNPSCEAARLSG